MSVIETLTEFLPTESTGPRAYDCPDCGRSFEADAPPERVICSECGNRDVRPRTDRPRG